MMNFKKNQNNAVCSMDCKNCHNGASQPNPMDDPMKDYYDLRYEETDGENHFVEETAYQEKQSEHSKMEDPLMEMVGGTESNVWKLYECFATFYSCEFASIWRNSQYASSTAQSRNTPGMTGMLCCGTTTIINGMV